MAAPTRTPGKILQDRVEIARRYFQCEPVFMGRRLAQDIWQWITEG